MKKLLSILIAFSFFMAGCDKDMESLDNDALQLKKAGTNFSDPNTFDAEGKYCIQVNGEGLVGEQMQIWMGVGNEKAGTLVGYVRFAHDPDRVIIDLTDADGDGTPDIYPYVADEVHIHFAGSYAELPQTNSGNPIPGHFDYNIPVDPSKSEIVIPIDHFDAFGAIHLTVKKIGGVEGFTFYLPDDPVTVRFTWPAPTSYLQMEILSDNAGTLKGVYENWCVNTSINMAHLLGQQIPALLYSSYEEIPDGVVDYPENFPLINYLINHYAVGDVVELKDANCDPVLVDGNPVSEAITIGDIQKAVWTLIDDDPSTNDGLGPWSQERVNAILCDVEANGEGFVPGCDEKIVFLVVPVDQELGLQLIIGQPTISSVPVPCADEGGTAWGDGYWGATFKGKQWGTWFMYDEQCGLSD